MTDDTPVFGTPIGPWIKTFAWKPIWTFDAGTVWLKTVYKRHIQKHIYLDGGGTYWFQYRCFPKETE